MTNFNQTKLGHQLKHNALPDMALKDLLPGDVILSRGICTGKGLCISDIIVALDGGDYSHAAVFDGKHFVQATTKGVVASEPVRQIEHQSYLHVYRFLDSEGNPLDVSLPSLPVTNASHTMLGMPYAYDELVLVAMLVIMRKVTSISLLKDIIELFGGVALTKLREWYEKHIKHSESRSVICSEVVAQSFWDASDGNGKPYGLEIEVIGRHRSGNELPQNLPLDCEQFLDNLEDFMAEENPLFYQANQLLLEQMTMKGMPSVKQTVIAGSRLLPANCVSPCDLQRCQTLHLVGNYVD